MEWVTRARPKTDRIACPWLIRRFIDPEAEITYVPREQVLDYAAERGARSFDAPGAECAFAPRCPHSRAACRARLPDIIGLSSGLSRCVRAYELRGQLTAAADG